MNFEGKLTLAGDEKVAIVVARFNDFITSKLLDGAKDCFTRHGLDEKNIDVLYVPGAFEITLACQKLAQTKKYDSIVALGAVIRGSTPHFDYVCSSVTKGITDLNIKFDLPIIFGVITTNTIEEAIERAGSKAGNKGWEVSLAAIEMINVLKNIK